MEDLIAIKADPNLWLVLFLEFLKRSNSWFVTLGWSTSVSKSVGVDNFRIYWNIQVPNIDKEKFRRFLAREFRVAKKRMKENRVSVNKRRHVWSVRLEGSSVDYRVIFKKYTLAFWNILQQIAATLVRCRSPNEIFKGHSLPRKTHGTSLSRSSARWGRSRELGDANSCTTPILTAPGGDRRMHSPECISNVRLVTKQRGTGRVSFDEIPSRPWTRDSGFYYFDSTISFLLSPAIANRQRCFSWKEERRERKMREINIW